MVLQSALGVQQYTVKRYINASFIHSYIAPFDIGAVPLKNMVHIAPKVIPLWLRAKNHFSLLNKYRNESFCVINRIVYLNIIIQFLK